MGMFNTARVWVALAIGIVSLMSYGWADEPVNFKNMPSFKVGTLPHESSEIHAEKERRALQGASARGPIAQKHR